MSHSGSSASISDNPTPASGQGGYAPIVTPQMLQEVWFTIEDIVVIIRVLFKTFNHNLLIEKLTCSHHSSVKIQFGKDLLIYFMMMPSPK